LPCSALNTPEQFLDDQRRDERCPLGSLTHTTLGTIDAPGAPVHAGPSFYAAHVVAVPPGAHTSAVLVDELGHDVDELARWQEVGLV